MKPGILDHGQVIFGNVIKGGIGFLCLIGQRDPKLQAIEFMNGIADRIGFAFGMGNAAPGTHPIEVARRDFKVTAQTVTMQDRALEQIGHGRQARMRMRRHINALTGLEFDRPHMIEKHERTDGTHIAMG